MGRWSWSERALLSSSLAYCFRLARELSFPYASFPGHTEVTGGHLGAFTSRSIPYLTRDGCAEVLSTTGSFSLNKKNLEL